MGSGVTAGAVLSELNGYSWMGGRKVALCVWSGVDYFILD